MTDQPKKHRRARGSGSVFKSRNTWWIAYWAADGRRVKESSGSDRKGDAVRLLESRNGSRIHNLPVRKNAEKLTFNDAVKAVLDDCAVNHAPSLKGATRRIEKHLMPFFGGWRLASITTADVLAYVAHRQQQGIVAHRGKRKGERIADVSNAEINRELATLKRTYSLAIKHERIAMRPHNPMLKESAPRSGFFEADQIASVLSHLPADLQPVIEFAYLTGWRLASEVLPLEWRNVDLKAGELRIDAGASKSGEPRVIFISAALRTVLEARQAEHEKLKKAGQITPLVFWRMVAESRGGEKKPQQIISLNKAWKVACREAGLPGRIPHDLRRTAIRNMIRAGISQNVAMKMSGHKTASVFDRYNITSREDLRDAAEKLNAVSGR